MQQYGNMFGYFVEGDDKRLTPWTKEFWNERVSVRRWRYCKYCYGDTPQFVLIEGMVGNADEPIDGIVCCWQCGSGLHMMNAATAKRFCEMRAARFYSEDLDEESLD